MKRIYRNDVSFETKQKQSLAHKNKKHSQETKNKISQSLEQYWANLPSKPVENNNISKTEQIYGKNRMGD